MSKRIKKMAKRIRGGVMIHCENCRYWQNGYCSLRKKSTNDGASCDKGEEL